MRSIEDRISFVGTIGSHLKKMKVFVAVVFIIGSVAARGSGPYLPSGWKPQGPAFYLPSEARSASSAVQESQFPETEASGSDALREYGPPKLDEVSLSVNQALPDVATEQTFFVEVQNEDVVAVGKAVEIEVNEEQVSAVVAEVATTTESQVAALVQAVEELAVEISEVQSTIETEKQETSEAIQEIIEQTGIVEPTLSAVEEIVPTAVVEAQVLNVEQVQEINEVQSEDVKEAEIVPKAVVLEDIVVPTAVVEETIVSLAQQELVQDVPTPVSEAVVENVVEGVNNIAEALVTLENEVKAVEVQTIVNSEAISSISSTQELSGSLEQTPEGFLEYGPPGFTEYGPPKEDDLARIAVEVARASALENNEVRRRRFSPKFRSSKKH